jgi:hypothetical protein
MKVLSGLLALCFGAAACFFLWYSVRLAWVSMQPHEGRVVGGGAYIGAVAFPLAVLVFGFIAYRLFRRASASAD